MLLKACSPLLQVHKNASRSLYLRNLRANCRHFDHHTVLSALRTTITRSMVNPDEKTSAIKIREGVNTAAAPTSAECIPDMSREVAMGIT